MILWLTSKSGYSPVLRSTLQGKLAKFGIKSSDVMFNSLHIKTPLLAEHDKKKMPDKFAIKQARKNLQDDCKIFRPKLIVINDEDTLRAITETKYTLATTRGSLYYFDGTPCIVLDNLGTIRYKVYGPFQFDLDFEKIARWSKGEQKNEPAFNFILCRNVQEVIEQCNAAANSVMVATDRETSSGFITCTAYTYAKPDGKLVSFCIPFYNPWKEDGAYWSEQDEIEVHKCIRKLNLAEVTKVFQNGTYDCAYDILYGMESKNYLVDTQNLMHSIWCEAPKRLHSIASYFCDNYTYWKDEAKGAKEDGFGKSIADTERYWRYNALDSYYTFLGATELLARIRKLPWALRNYNSEFSLSVGPCLAASLRGIKVDQARHSKISQGQFALSEAGKADLRRLSNEEDFNINSPQDKAWLLYDVLGAKVTRLQRKGSKLGPRSTDEKVLRLMKEQLNFFVSHAIDRILRATKPTTWLSKYGNFKELTYGGRFLSWHNAAGTETFRFNSGSGQFWTGTNGQNWQPFTQEMLVADDGYVLVDCDYSASDDWFVAHEAEDEDKIRILKTKDTHSYHASEFFALDYEKVIEGKKKHEPWVVHAITGVRQISKKFNHGKNFRMGAQMTYNLMGRDMAVATAKLLGYKNPEGMTDKELIGMCHAIGEKYDNPRTGMYKRIRKWQDESVEELKDNDGLYTNAFGITRKFLGNPDDHGTQRELSAQAGQSGTSGNINRALKEIFYGSNEQGFGPIDNGRTCIFVLQVHDSLKFLCHKSTFHTDIARIVSIMQRPVTIKGREFIVPVNVEVGLTDGKNMLPYEPSLAYEQIKAHEEKVYGAKFPKGNAALLETLGAINFDGANIKDLEQQLEETSLQDGLDQDEDDASLVLEESEE